MLVTVEKDWETGERAGAGGTYQVVSVTSEDGRDSTSHVDQGKHYSSNDELADDLSEALGTPVEIEEDDLDVDD